MRVLILGGDGYLGWPTAMHLSTQGHKVAVADNYLRRRLCREEKVDFLYAVPDLNERAVLWQSVSGHETAVHIGDLSEWDFIAQVFEKFEPEVIVHYAEQPAAPYSMLNRKAATLTLHNNLSVTANVIFAVREFCPDAHIVKLGTMGEYGTPNIDIEEGWLEVEHNGRQHMFLYPRQAGSLYHTTKIMDTDLLWFYVRTWGLRVTDLMQGPVYGIFTDESAQDERLLPFFNYDEIFGTVLNRFVVQAVAGYPLTVYGKGGQTRGYLNIKDTLNCVRLAVENPAKTGELRIFNQFTETFSINDLAAKVKKAGKQLALKVEIEHIENPR
ncbi:MAG: NAD-dependent epimerase/dehydratase family protein, partial [Desulfobacterales bacterium]